MRKRTGLGWAASLLAVVVGVEAAAQGKTREQAPAHDAPAIVEAERARAHERMPSTMYASTPSADKPYFAHPPTSATLEAEREEPSDWLRATAKGWGSTSADGSDTAEDVFRRSISEPVVQSKCINCHVSGGASDATRLVFTPAATDDHVSFNYRVFEDFLVSVANGAALILDKIKGVAHGGGTQVPAGSRLYADMESFLDLLDGGDAAPVTVETLFDTVRMRSNRETLYRAAIILAGRIPTAVEYADLEGAGLRATVRGLMTGLGFHDFLIRAANDRLLTDGAEPFLGIRFVNYENEDYRLFQAAVDGSSDAKRALHHFRIGVSFGARRAPLELIAHVVENDLPYTEILTANYVMANPQAALAYGADRASEVFADADNVHEFRPARIEEYYPRRNVDCEDSRCTVEGPALVHPHAGILGTQSLLYRHPTTPTNRNRARARWTYYHFLGVDVERLGPRVLDPSSLVDEDNPTMNNPACTGCHGILDPVAGTFQYYDPFGFYKASYRGEHSLPSSYRRSDLYQDGDTWFRDMAKPGFNGAIAPETTDSLEWLGRKIAEDHRFAEATVKFWWPAVMGSEVARPPTDRSDSDFESRLLEAEAQGAEVERLAQVFREGRRGGRPYDLKVLLAELFLSRWFRAKHITDASQVRRVALQGAGAARPLTPEELVNKTEALTGYVWGRERGTYGPERDRPKGYLQDDYAPLYGGIDSQDVTERSDRFTAPAAQVAKLHANSIATLVAYRDFFLLPHKERRLFFGIGLSDTPETASEDIKAILAEFHEMFFGVRADASDVQNAYRFLVKVWRNVETIHPFPPSSRELMRLSDDYYIWECMVSEDATDHCYLEGIRDDALTENTYRFEWNYGVVRELGDGIEVTKDELRMVMTWSTVLAAMLMDYRYLHL